MLSSKNKRKNKKIRNKKAFNNRNIIAYSVLLDVPAEFIENQVQYFVHNRYNKADYIISNCNNIFKISRNKKYQVTIHYLQKRIAKYPTKLNISSGYHTHISYRHLSSRKRKKIIRYLLYIYTTINLEYKGSCTSGKFPNPSYCITKGLLFYNSLNNTYCFRLR